MADVSVNVGVNGIAQFKQGMKDAQASVKTFDSVLKNNEKQLRNTGDAEKFMQSQTQALNGKLEAQQRVAKNAQQALKTMQAQGVDPASKSFQDMQRAMIDAMNDALDTENELKNLGKSAGEAGTQVNTLEKGLSGIGKKMSLSQVISGIDKITGGLENAARKAVDLGEKLWSTIMDSASRADDTATMAEMYGIDLDTFLRMQKLVENGLDTSVESMLTAQDKLKRGIGKDSKEVIGYLEELGLAYEYTGKYGETGIGMITEDSVDLFWRAGQAIMAMGKEFDQEAAATALFGRSWKELAPLFNSYKNIEEYNAALAEQTVNTEDTIRDLATLNDAVGKLESSWETLKNEMLGELAPALTKGAEAISGLLDNLTEYLKTEDGQKMLEQLGTAVSGLFDDISKIEPDQVVSNFVSLFTKLTDGISWLVENKNGVVTALEVIGGAFAALKISEGVLTFVQMIQGFKGLGGTAAAKTAGEAAGAAWGSGLAAGIMKAAPWVIALVNLLTPTPTGNSDAYNESGLTGEGFGMLKDMIGDNPINQLSIRELANIYGVDQTLKILRDPQAAGYIYKWLNKGGITYTSAQSTAEQMLASYGYKPTGARYNLDDNQMRYLYGAFGVSLNDTDLGAWLARNTNIGKGITASGLTGLGKLFSAENGLKIPAEVTQDTIVSSINAAISSYGTAHIPAQLDIGGVNYGIGFSRGGGGKADVHAWDPGTWIGHANGLPYVPFDGYAAILHRGERVMTARENRNFTYNNNNYFGNVNLNNGMEIDALSESIARQNRRQMAAYGAQ